MDRRAFLKEASLAAFSLPFIDLQHFGRALLPAPQLLIPTFLGSDARRFYGRGAVGGLDVKGIFSLGCGTTRVGREQRTWCGVGWTGQATLLKEREQTYLIIGSNDHHLRALTFPQLEEVWSYQFDDVLKGTASLYFDPEARREDQVVILQGSRAGTSLAAPEVPSFRAISFRTGSELWRFNIPRTHSYSRDNDSSPLVLEELIFNAAENGLGYFFEKELLRERDSSPQSSIQLYQEADRVTHGANLVTEASPTRIDDRIYIPSGSGHVYGISIPERRVLWDVPIGSDLDGTAPASRDGFLYVPIEKQYIPGTGGVLKLDPRRAAAKAPVWFLPTPNTRIADWQGGIIGSVALNDEYRELGEPSLFAATSIDGTLWIGSQDLLQEGVRRSESKRSSGTPGRTLLDGLPQPHIYSRHSIGPSISTPIFTDERRLVAASYEAIRLFQLEYERDPEAPGGWRVQSQLIAAYPGNFEATPIIHNDSLIIGSKDGNLYLFG